jgi:putative DNA primase/helicase
MLKAFNSWLSSNGHNQWSKELFGPRFAQHAETVRRRVEMTRPNQLNGLSRFGSLGALPVRPSVYQGVRFQTAS